MIGNIYMRTNLDVRNVEMSIGIIRFTLGIALPRWLPRT